MYVKHHSLLIRVNNAMPTHVDDPHSYVEG